MQKYQNRINVIPEGLKTVGSGGRYKQPKRNAYKINDGVYGDWSLMFQDYLMK